MKNTMQLLGAVSTFALVAMSSTSALAAGTSAGTTITNTVNVTFDVGGVTQNAVSDTDEFSVDRKVNVNVQWVGPATSVAPGSTDQWIGYDVTNLSNDTIDLALSAALASGTGTNISNFRIYVDTNGNNAFDSGDTLVTFLDEVAADDTIRVFVVADFGLNAANGDSFGINLIADSHAGGDVGSLGAELVATSGANNVNAVDTVLADGDGPADVAGDGAASDTGEFTVAGAVVTVAKSSRIISDPINGLTNPKAIPEASVEYCITVSNALDAQTATGVNVVDDLPSDVTYDATFGIFVDGDADCQNGSDGVAGGLASLSSGTGPGGADQVLGDLADVAAGQTRSLYFRVTID